MAPVYSPQLNAVTARLSSGNVKYYVGSADSILNNATDNPM